VSDAPAHLPQKFNAKMAVQLDKLYASPQVIAQRARLRALIRAQPGEHGVDVGCGLAHLSCELAEEVGAGGRIVGVDASADMVAGATERAARLGVADRVEVRQADATALPLADASMDFAVAVQSYSYVADVEGAIRDAARVLKPGGRLAVLETDWDLCIYRSPDDAQMRRLFDGRWRFEHWTLPRELQRLFTAAGLSLAACEAFPIVETRYDPDAFGVGLIKVARNAAVRHGVDAAQADAWVADVHARGQDGDYFFCLNRFMFVATKPA
jgi:arsenite methyltransferase